MTIKEGQKDMGDLSRRRSVRPMGPNPGNIFAIGGGGGGGGGGVKQWDGGAQEVQGR